MKMQGILAAIFVLALAADGAATINIDTCGYTIPDNEVGVLTADLSCATGATGIRVGAGATLNMNGHTITVPEGHGVWCMPSSSCTVTGGGGAGAFGEISGGESGVYLQRRSRANISGIVISDCSIGIEAEDWTAGRKGASATVINARVTGSDGAAVLVGRVRFDNVVIEDNPGDGVLAGSTSMVKARGLTVTRNATSAACDVAGCEGINVGVLKGRSLVVRDNVGVGILALQAKLRDSIVVENRRAGALRSLVVSETPRLHDVVCDASFGWGSQSSVPWGVCVLDNSN